MPAGGNIDHVGGGAGRHAGDGFQRQGRGLFLEHDPLDEIIVVLGVQHDDAAGHRSIDQFLFAQREALARAIAATVGFSGGAIGMVQGADGRLFLEALQRAIQHAVARHAIGIQLGLVLGIGADGEQGKDRA